MEFTEYKCPVCDKQFKKGDDIVVCPECGTPHHRECYEKEGHCHFADKHGADFSFEKEQQEEALAFVWKLMHVPIEKTCIENPVSIISTRISKPDQIIQPWQFGHGETKTTCLWLKGLKPLEPTHIVDGRENRIHTMPPSENRWKERSRTYTGIAQAMAEQWGGIE